MEQQLVGIYALPRGLLVHDLGERRIPVHGSLRVIPLPVLVRVLIICHGDILPLSLAALCPHPGTLVVVPRGTHWRGVLVPDCSSLCALGSRRRGGNPTLWYLPRGLP
jgi:hypothetical protein